MQFFRTIEVAIVIWSSIYLNSSRWNRFKCCQVFRPNPLLVETSHLPNLCQKACKFLWYCLLLINWMCSHTFLTITSYSLKSSEVWKAWGFNPFCVKLILRALGQCMLLSIEDTHGCKHAGLWGYFPPIILQLASCSRTQWQYALVAWAWTADLGSNAQT